MGLAIGDALGAPLTGLKPGRIKELYGEVKGYVDSEPAWRNKPYRYRSSGVYTDDTQQALCLSESLVRCYGFNAEDLAKTFLKLWQADPTLKPGAWRGTGRNFRKVLAKLATGIKPKDAGEPSAGIGSAIRVAPIGLYFADDHEKLIKASIEQSVLTHKDPRAIALSSAIAFASARAVNRDWDEIKVSARIEDLIEFVLLIEKQIEQEYIAYLPPRVYDFFHLFFRSVEPFRHWQGMEPELVYQQIVHLANLSFPREKILSPSQNFALSAGITALFLGLVSRDYESGIKEALKLGRDSDSLCAMTGAILGARFGESAIPAEWRKGLKNYEPIAVRAEAIYQKSFAGLKIRDLAKMELELTNFEKAEREQFIRKMITKGEFDPEALRKKKEKAGAQDLIKLKIKRRGKKEKRKREKTPWRTWEE